MKQRKNDEKESSSFSIRVIKTPNQGSITSRKTKLNRTYTVPTNNDINIENSLETKNPLVSDFLSHRQKTEDSEKEETEHKKTKTKLRVRHSLIKKDLFMTTYNNSNKTKLLS